MQELTLTEQRFEKEEETYLYTAKDVFCYMAPLLSAEDREYIFVLHLNTKNKVIERELVGIGTLDSCLLHPREVFKGAIVKGANSIILVHNHPSGDPTPSEEDFIATKRLKHAGKILGIELLDHVIIGSEGYYQFYDTHWVDSLEQ